MFKKNDKFLVIDDSNPTRELVVHALRRLGYSKIEEARNGKIGWEKIIQQFRGGGSYVLVFCDINMPEMDGLKLLQAVRAEPLTQDLPFVIITTEGQKDTVIKAVMSGVSAYMVKPISEEDIKRKVEEVYKRVLSSATSKPA